MGSTQHETHEHTPNMHPKVRDLYKRILLVGRDYPAGLDFVRKRAKEHFRQNKDVRDEDEIVHLVARGRWYVSNELIPVIQLKKYRTLRQRYSTPDEEPAGIVPPFVPNGPIEAAEPDKPV